MTIIQKNIEIKPDRRLSLELDLPPELPLGRATLRLAITPEASSSEAWRGGLREAASEAGGAVALVRQWREEWPDGLPAADKPTDGGLPGQINLGLLPSSEELETMRREGRLKYPGKPFRINGKITGQA
jgi:hypothetical protein